MKLTLVSHHLCPYVQRAAITLAEKGVAFERINIDLDNKPDWFRAISPLGKVPLLKVDDEVIFESAVIVEYLEETQPNPLHPSDPLARAKHRSWMEFGSSILADTWVFETTKDRAQFDAKRLALKDKFTRIEGELGDGPYFSGAAFRVVDAVFAPVFRYFDEFDRLTEHRIFDGLKKVNAWRHALAERQSVKAAVAADYPERLRIFLKKHNGIIAETLPAQ